MTDRERRIERTVAVHVADDSGLCAHCLSKYDREVAWPCKYAEIAMHWQSGPQVPRDPAAIIRDLVLPPGVLVDEHSGTRPDPITPETERRLRIRGMGTPPAKGTDDA